MFASVGTAQATYSLDDFKIEGITEETMVDCTIQFLQAAQPKTDDSKHYWYAPKEVAGDDAGWYIVGGFDKVPDAAKTIPAGTGFLVNFPAGASTAKLVYSGEVQTGSEGVIKFGRTIAGQYALLTNPLPYDVPLAQVKIEGITEETMIDCTIQFLQGGQPKTDDGRHYWYAPESVAGDQAGWYIVGGFDPVTTPEVIKAGEGVLANFNVVDAKLVFPAPAVAK